MGKDETNKFTHTKKKTEEKRGRVVGRVLGFSEKTDDAEVKAQEPYEHWYEEKIKTCNARLGGTATQSPGIRGTYGG